MTTNGITRHVSTLNQRLHEFAWFQSGPGGGGGVLSRDIYNFMYNSYFMSLVYPISHVQYRSEFSASTRFVLRFYEKEHISSL